MAVRFAAQWRVCRAMPRIQTSPLRIGVERCLRAIRANADSTVADSTVACIKSIRNHSVSRKVNMNLLQPKFRELPFLSEHRMQLQFCPTLFSWIFSHRITLPFGPDLSIHESTLDHIPNHTRLGLSDYQLGVGGWNVGTDSQSGRLGARKSTAVR